VLTRERALYWLERWDRQQEYYMPDREERFAVVAEWSTSSPAPIR
jgi:hypothetical protein